MVASPQLLHYPHFWPAVVAQFFYVGAQVEYLERLHLLHETVHRSERAHGGAVSLWAPRGLHFGPIHFDVLDALVSRVVNAGVYATINVTPLLGGILRPGFVGGCALLLTSFFIAIMYPTIFVLGVHGLGPNTKVGGSLIVMSIVGGATLAPVLGYIARQTASYALGYSVALVGFVVVAFYGFYGKAPEKNP